MKTMFTANQLVFVDESLFKQQTGWRCMAYAPIGDPARWHDDVRRGSTHSILSALTINGYLPCTGMKEGFYTGAQFNEWVQDQFLPHCNLYPGDCSVLYLDNVSAHYHPELEAIIARKGIFIRYLPPYSPDYNPIELSFNILKAWMRRHFRDVKDFFRGNFKSFLEYAVSYSACGSIAVGMFKHSCHGGYRFIGELEAYMRQLQQYGHSGT